MRFVRFIIFISISASATAQNEKDAQGRKQGPWFEKYPKSSVKKYEGQFKDDNPYGTFRFYYDNGKLRAVMHYSNNGKIARTKFYEPNGELQAEGKYVNKEKDSTWNYFDGKYPSYTETYRNGKLEGERITYYVPSNLSNTILVLPEQVYIKEQFRNGVRHGPYQEFYLNGKKKVEGTYVDGNRDGRFTYYYSNGNYEKVETYKYAVKHGLFMYFDKDGVEQGKLFYDRGTLLEGKRLEEFLEKNKK